MAKLEARDHDDIKQKLLRLATELPEVLAGESFVRPRLTANSRAGPV
jgi:hypothetical protein